MTGCASRTQRNQCHSDGGQQAKPVAAARAQPFGSLPSDILLMIDPCILDNNNLGISN